MPRLISILFALVAIFLQACGHVQFTERGFDGEADTRPATAGEEALPAFPAPADEDLSSAQVPTLNVRQKKVAAAGLGFGGPVNEVPPPSPVEAGTPARPGTGAGEKDGIAGWTEGEGIEKIPTLSEWTEKVLAETRSNLSAPPEEVAEEPLRPTLLPVSVPRVQASYADDNREFGAFLDFLNRFRDRVPLWNDVSNRIIIRARAGQDMPAAWAKLAIRDRRGKVLAKRTAYADGQALFFPSEGKWEKKGTLTLEAAWQSEKLVVKIDPQGRKVIALDFEGAVETPQEIPLDICFLIDSTGSMGDEMARLKQTLQVIHHQIVNLPTRLSVRFGMVLFRDRKDKFVTQETDFAADFDDFAEELSRVRAEGGGDAPEDMQSGLRVALRELSWRESAIKVVFLLTDAPPHLYKDEKFDYLEAARAAAESGIKIVGIGASGLAIPGEAVLRQLAQYTMGQFVFLTYGETGESEGGGMMSVSHHTGENFQTRNLDAIIVRFVRHELAALQGKTVEEDDYFETVPGIEDDRDRVLQEIFGEGIRQLLDFSLQPVYAGTPAAVLPMTVKSGQYESAAELLEHRLMLATARHPAFKLVEREDLRQIIQEQKLGLTGLIREEEAAKLGNVIGARLIILSSLSPGPKLEVMLKLVWVETAEILAISLLKVSPELVE